MVASVMSGHVTIQSGDQVKVNDHVYVSPSWSVREGTPYSVARIIEFLPAKGGPTENVSKGGTKSKGKEKERPLTRARLAWYYRPSDVSDRPNTDARLLLAAIYSEVAELTQLRGRCYVAHRERISDLGGWKKRPDHFYYTRMFDPYIKKEFEVLQASAVRNIPDHVREVLNARYDFVAAEKEIIPNLTGDIRLCHACGEWCSHAESVQCDRCKNFYHMSCVNPPLLAKPTKGYGWKCGSCSHPDGPGTGTNTRAGTPSTGTKTRAAATTAPAPAKAATPARPRGRPRKNNVQVELEENMQLTTYKGWPFRYFGLYTVAEDTLDEDDFIFPRTVTRVGPKYQAVVPTQMPASITIRESDRGGDDTIEILSLVDKMTEAQVLEMETVKKVLPATRKQGSNVDWLTEVIRRLSKAFAAKQVFSSVNMKTITRTEKWKTFETRYIDKEWSEEEQGSFEDSILANGAELRAVREDVGTGKRSQAEVVRFYGHWKNDRLREENEAKRNGTFVLPPSRESSVVSSSDESSGMIDGGERSCAACRTNTTRTWYKAPKTLPSSVLCENCGQNWRKYGELNMRPAREEGAVKKTDKREGTPLTNVISKRAKTQMASATPSAPVSRRSTPPQVTSGPQLECVACRRLGPVGQVLQCSSCKIQIHAGACGAVVKLSEIETWICEICNNEKTEEASLNTICMLCPHSDNRMPPGDDTRTTYLRARKPTEGQAWAHVVCAMFTPEVTFTDDARLRLVEGIAAIPQQRWLRDCSVCKERGGAVVRCHDCSKEFHISCAWKSGCKVGFELTQAKGRHKDTSTIVEFRGESGVLTPIIRCREHDKTSRRLYTVCDMDEQGRTAMQVYAKHYKQAQTNSTYGLLRKARRLDAVLRIPKTIPAVDDKQNPEDQQCNRCQTMFSPLFYPESSGGWLCHRCHFEAPKTNGNQLHHTHSSRSIAVA